MAFIKEIESTVHKVIKFNPCIVVFTGPGLTGKTTLGSLLAERTNFVFYDVDEIRWKIFDKRAGQGFPIELPEPYSRFAMLTSYQANHERARDIIWRGQQVILAATYSREPYHKMLKGLQEITQVPLIVFLLEASDEVIERRLQQRQQEGSWSNVRTMEHYLVMKSRQIPIEGVYLIRLNTEKPEVESLTAVLLYLRPFQKTQ